MWNWWCEGVFHFNFSNRKGAIAHFNFQASPCLVLRIFPSHCSQVIHFRGKVNAENDAEQAHNVNWCFGLFAWCWYCRVATPSSQQNNTNILDFYCCRKICCCCCCHHGLVSMLAHFVVQVSPVWHWCQAMKASINAFSSVLALGRPALGWQSPISILRSAWSFLGWRNLVSTSARISTINLVTATWNWNVRSTFLISVKLCSIAMP